MPPSVSSQYELDLELFTRMVRIRYFEERVASLASAGEPVSGHLYVGQEAIAAGVCTALHNEDFVTSTHRGHGHIIAKGGDIRRCMAELFAKETGYCAGKGGSMHIADMSLGIIGANGIVGAGIPISCGAALASKLRGTGQVSVSFFGDGASNHGTFHECMNLAAVWALPVVFVCENNGWAQLTRTEAMTANKDIGSRALSYGIPALTVDGNDARAVYEGAEQAVRRAREEGGPTLIEARTYRMREHAEGMSQFSTLRSQDEMDSWREQDPIVRQRAKLLDEGVSGGTLAALESKVMSEVEEAVEFARNSQEPSEESALTDVFAPATDGGRM